uniref:Large ribosomal subunit protein mL43 n=1 Tax=Oryctolagus cuniculus TaxID=9986 RepID=G1SI76_RABIT
MSPEPEPEVSGFSPSSTVAWLRSLRTVTMTARGTSSRFLTSVLHNGLGRYVQQLQRLSFTLSRDSPSSRGAREFVERQVTDFARRNPGVVIYVNARPCNVPRVVAEYLNGAVREESIHCKSAEEITTLVQKLADQSGLEVIRIRKPSTPLALASRASGTPSPTSRRRRAGCAPERPGTLPRFSCSESCPTSCDPALLSCFPG